MNAKEFYLKETGWEDLNSVEEFDTPIEVVGLLEKYQKHLKTDEMIDLLERVIKQLVPLDAEDSDLMYEIKQLLKQ